MDENVNLMDKISETGSWEKLGALLSKGSMDDEPVINFHIKKFNLKLKYLSYL